MDRRRKPRKRFRLALRLDPGKITSMTGDVTGSGVFLHSARVHKPGTRVRLELRTPEGPVEAHGVVRWARRVPAQLVKHARGGMGIEFTWASPEFLNHLRGVMNAERPAA